MKRVIELSSDFAIGKLTASSGEKIQGYLDILDTEIKIPITIINGINDGKTIAITSGVHGGEYLGIETAIRLASTIKPEEVRGKLVIVHPVNTAAFSSKLQYVGPHDSKNLNRVFPGRVDGTFSEKIAYVITNEIFAKSDFCFDLHGGDLHEELTPCAIYSCSGTKALSSMAKEVASLMGIRYIFGLDYPTTTIGSASILGVPSVLIEMGKCGLWSDEGVAEYTKGLKNALKHLGVLSGEVENSCADLVYMSGMDAKNATVNGCWYPFVNAGDEVNVGDKIGEIRDFFANVLCEYHAEKKGTILYVVRSLAINVDEPIYAIG